MCDDTTLRYTIGACLSRTRSDLWSPVVSTSSVPIRFAGTLPSPHPSSHLQQAVPCVCVCVCVCGLAWLAGLREECEECEKCADSVTPILGWGFLIFHFWIALQHVSNIRHRSILLRGAWDQRSGSFDTTPFPLISTRYPARSHQQDGISPPHNLERATSFPRVARGPSSRLRHARTLDQCWSLSLVAAVSGVGRQQLNCSDSQLVCHSNCIPTAYTYSLPPYSALLLA